MKTLRKQSQVILKYNFAWQKEQWHWFQGLFEPSLFTNFLLSKGYILDYALRHTLHLLGPFFVWHGCNITMEMILMACCLIFSLFCFLERMLGKILRLIKPELKYRGKRKHSCFWNKCHYVSIIFLITDWSQSL